MNPAGLFLRAARREPVPRTPLWFMRQAGRVLPEYRAVRERWSLLEICRQPALCADVTLQPLRRMPLDAAVVFSDIMLPLTGVGVDLDIVEGVGPVIAHPLRSAADLGVLRPLEPAADVPWLLETLAILRAELRPRGVAVLGFAGAPFTLASYLIEGRPTRDFVRTKTVMYGEPALWSGLMERLTGITIAFLAAQLDAGADAVQLFDSWIGALGPADYAEYAEPWVRRIFSALAPRGAPLIHFGTGTSALLPQMKDDGASVIGVDWRIPLDDAWDRIGHELAIQGNLDPAVLFAPRVVMEAHAADVLRRAGGRPGHIFNLGHGLLPGTPLERLLQLADFVHERSLACA
ncbi:MAG TPA: uroporphyrinogen decarboxylase [Gemmatimonadales bacterium]|nr:uroporphyrinogen decarboxylase [Gemmatimonadales bacterium]